MKFKLLYVAALVCAVLGMTACGDKPQHEHVWDGGTVTVQATCTADGQKKFTCTECGEERIEEIPAMGHATSAPEKENVVKSTCLEGGSYESVVYCLACGEELSRERVTVEASGHTPAPAVRENERAGDCKNKEAYDSVIYCEDCHAELERTHVEGDFGEHVWDEGQVVSEHSLTSDGKITYTCSSCGLTRDEVTPAGADFAQDFTLQSGGAWKYGYVNYDWAAEDFEFVSASSNGENAWTADGVEIKEGWINASAMTTIAYTVDEGGILSADVSFTGGTELTDLDLRVGVKSADGVKYGNPAFYGGNGRIIEESIERTLSAGDTIYFIFSDAAGGAEGAYPNGDLSIKLSLEKPVADFAQDFTLQSGGAWKYGYVNYDWAAEDFEFVSANSNGADAWTADGVEIKKGWINAGGMTAIGYTVAEDIAAKIVLSFEGGTELTRLALRVGIKNAQGEKYSNPVFYGPDGNGLNVSMDCMLNSGDTIYFIFSNEASAVEGAYPNGQLSITVYN